MGHLFYAELGGAANLAISATHNANYSLFSHLQDGIYWSGTTYSLDSTGAWVFEFQNGGQVASAKSSNNFFVLPVLPGDAAASVPEPSTLALFAMGLAGLGIAATLRAQVAIKTGDLKKSTSVKTPTP
jgi:hypothetical protein